ncbi:MAG TPA: hypothetical protein PL151_14020 [Phycisphaerae bacterium]|nr:hypothetical protein [Phycisphaerae bacterium]HOJ74909.1 hypothetical protein [Phycisphaerae bacterium]HOM51470.1 hypothetical protein [Phycisphaerae bacterium]HON68593.1 hypothetical protein [Phycisphaerae bacterium]HOQ85583.1 hypothetical protein [Phycisphaerae bacterium]
MADEPSYILDLQSLQCDSPESESPEPDEPAESPTGSRTGRAWIGIHFECCGLYTRIYRNREATAYEGYCPRCQRPVRVGIGAGGTHHRLFRAT